MSETDKDDQRSVIVDVVAAIVLGIVTMLAAFGAYQSSLYGGNQATAYTEAINTLGEANRELLRGVQERAYDTTIWLEHLKATQREARNAAGSGSAAPPEAKPEPAKQAPGPAPAKQEPGPEKKAKPAEGKARPNKKVADDDDDDDDFGLSEADMDEILAVALSSSLTEETGESTLKEKLERLLRTRHELKSAMKWADEEHARSMKAMTREQRLIHARRLIALFNQEDELARERSGLAARFERTPAGQRRSRTEIEAAIDADPTAGAERRKLDDRLRGVAVETERLIDMMAKPSFFESPAYQKAVDGKYEELLAKGTQTFADGQSANEIGDQFTLATVFLTIALFFCGLSPIMRRFPLKAAFLAVGLLIAIGATVFMLRYPLA